ncbi:MAG TPA: type II secretion system protein GspE, partial [Coriobacteriia bacterium]|nr:type II secretion system protein GspE [Coriobacteriia bacterium]
MEYTRDRLGELLVREGIITEEQLAGALSYQKAHGGKLGQILVKNLVTDEDVIARFLADQKGLEYVSLSMFAIDREAAALIPSRVARRMSVIPIGFRD